MILLRDATHFRLHFPECAEQEHPERLMRSADIVSQSEISVSPSRVKGKNRPMALSCRPTWNIHTLTIKRKSSAKRLIIRVVK